MPCLEIYNYVYYLNGDSIIGDNTYKKVFKSGVKEFSWMGPWPPPDSTCSGSNWFNYLQALVRQDGRKIYIHDVGQNEALLYDFDLAVGDTLPETSFYYAQDDIVISSIDSILVGESYRKIFDLYVPSFPESLQLIEGIGFSQGFLEYVPDWEFPAQLMCFALDGTTYYPAYGAPCDMVTGVIDPEDQDVSFRIFPNPSGGNITVKFNSDSKAAVRLIVSDILGRSLRDEKWMVNQGMNVRRLDLSFCEKGLYFISIAGQTGERFGQLKLMVD